VKTLNDLNIENKDILKKWAIEHIKEIEAEYNKAILSASPEGYTVYLLGIKNDWMKMFNISEGDLEK